MQRTLSRDRTFLTRIGVAIDSHPIRDGTLSDVEDQKTSDCVSIRRRRRSVAHTEQAYNQYFAKYGEMESVTRYSSRCRRTDDANELPVDNEQARYLTNRTFSQRTLPRNDSVTARAISRLSRRVSQLSASTSPTSSRAFRASRSNYSIKKSELQNPGAQQVDVHSVHAEGMKKALTGSKRKWQADRTGSHSIMDIDSVDSCAESGAASQCPWWASMDYCSQASFFLPNGGDRCLSMDHLDFVEHLSSGSSMLSVTESSTDKDSNGSSQEHEADVEDAGDGESSEHRKAGNRSCTNIFGKPTLVHRKTTRDDKFPTNLSMNSRSSMCGGDSSDGLSVNMKIPRLSNSISPFSTSSSAYRRHGRRLEPLPLRSTVQHLGSNTSSCHHGLHSKSHVSRVQSAMRRKMDRGHCVHKRSQPNSQSRHSTMCTCESSTSPSSSSSHNGSPDATGAHASMESCEDLANDEQSDFPADETSIPLRCRRVLHSVSTRTAKLTPDSERLIRTSKQFNGPSGICSSFTGASPMPSELDSEFEDILQGTWPLLSQRAKTGYIDGVTQAEGRRQGNHTRSQQKPKDVPKRRNQTMLFVPSTLDHVATPNMSSGSPKKERKPERRMPTPPWIEKDGCDLHVEIDPASPSTSELASEPSTKGKHHGLGYCKPQSSTAPPIPESNLGHKLLQRLGWKTGSGLGADQQGRLDPVGCREQYNTKSQ